MLGVESGLQLGNISVGVTNGRGLSPAELTAMALNKLIFVGPDVPPAIRDQAEAYKARIEAMLLHYLTQAQKSRDTTLCNILEQAGEARAAALVRSL